MSKQLEASWRNAFEYVQKFYLETSYLIKEVEGHLEREPERFAMCQPSGYAVTSYKSASLEPRQVGFWIPATLTVAFIPDACTKFQKGATVTPFAVSLRVLFLHIEAYSSELERPVIYCGLLQKIGSKDKSLTKFEHIMSAFSYRPDEIFAKLPEISYENSYCSLAGRAITIPLFSITSAQDVRDKLVDPVLKLYRK